MCHNAKQSTPANITAMALSKAHSVNNTHHLQSKSAFKINPFRRIAKTARINLNRYWGLLSKLHRPDPHSSEDIEVTFAAEMEQNRINELLEAAARASSENSLNSQWEERESCYGRGEVTSQWEADIYGHGPLLSFHHETVTPSPQPIPRLIRSAKRSLQSSTSSTASSAYQLRAQYDDETYSSQDSLFI